MPKEVFDDIISLGYKCETACSIEAMFGHADSCLFNWVNIVDINNFIKFLNNFDLLLSEGLSFLPAIGMYQDNALSFRYHSKIKKKSTVNLPEDFIKKNNDEVTSRMTYLKNKFINKIKSGKKILFVMCFRSEIELDKINDILSQISTRIDKIVENKNSKIAVIFEKDYIKDLKLNNFKNIIYYKVGHFSPDDAAFDIDIDFWRELYSSYVFKFCENPDYDKNIKKYIKNRIEKAKEPRAFFRKIAYRFSKLFKH